MSFTAAALSRRRCTSRSRTSPFVVDRAPQPELPAANDHSHLVEMPPGGWPRTSTAKFSGEQWSELQDPPLHRFVGNIQPTLSERVFSAAIAERETQIEPNSVPDNCRRKLVAGNRDRHAPSYTPTDARHRSRDSTRTCARKLPSIFSAERREASNMLQRGCLSTNLD